MKHTKNTKKSYKLFILIIQIDLSYLYLIRHKGTRIFVILCNIVKKTSLDNRIIKLRKLHLYNEIFTPVVNS